jgi:hypothetical protein
MTEKYKRIILQHEEQGIPIIVFTAKDQLSISALKKYYQECFAADCPEDHCNGIVAIIKQFQEWQLNNRDKVKLPD